MKNIKRYFLVVVALISLNMSAQKDTRDIQGGMWIPSLLEGMNADEMAQLGMKMSIKDIYDVNNSSLKDAIAHFVEVVLQK